MNYRYFTEDQINEAGKRVLEYHSNEFHCSESLIRTLWPVLLPEEELTTIIKKMVMPLRGGMASTMSSHCGGLTIGLLMIGAMYGREDVKKGDAKLAPSLDRGYWKMFLDEFETSNCTLLRNGKPGPEAPSRCGCIMVRSVHLLLRFLNKIHDEKTSLETIYSFQVDRSQETCHEQVVPLNPKEF